MLTYTVLRLYIYGVCRVILKVMGWNQYIANKPVLTGIHQLELRLLAKMGYEVFVVSA